MYIDADAEWSERQMYIDAERSGVRDARMLTQISFFTIMYTISHSHILKCVLSGPRELGPDGLLISNITSPAVCTHRLGVLNTPDYQT